METFLGKNVVLYANTIALDEKTGLPADYESFYAAYQPLLIAAARRVGIPEQDIPDAINEVALKFWAKDGLSMYDPERKTKFATLLRNWASMFLLQERDKVNKQANRFSQVEPESFTQDLSVSTHASGPQYRRVNSLYGLESSAEDKYLDSLEIQQWVDEAEAILERTNKKHLIPVLHVCAESARVGTAPSRADIAEVVGCKLTRSTTLLQELRRTLTECGHGMESLYRE